MLQLRRNLKLHIHLIGEELLARSGRIVFLVHKEVALLLDGQRCLAGSAGLIVGVAVGDRLCGQ
jgi:hypothetical protein